MTGSDTARTVHDRIVLTPRRRPTPLPQAIHRLDELSDDVRTITGLATGPDREPMARWLSGYVAATLPTVLSSD